MRALRFLAITAIVLATVALAVGQTHDRRHRPTTHHRARSSSELRSNLRSVRSQKGRLQKQLRETKRQTTAVIGEISQVDTKLGSVQTELDDTTSRLSDSRDEQKRLAVELDKSNVKLAATRKMVSDRLRHMYVSGNASVVSALVGAKSVGDVASRRFLLQRIAKKDRELFTEYRELRDLVSNRKRRQDALVVKVRDLERREEDQQAELQDARDQKKEVLHGLRSQQGRLQSLIAQYEADEQDIAAQIAAFEIRRRRPGEAPLPAFHGRLSRPVSGPITSGFGMRFHPILHITRLHAGIDFGVRSGTPIHAAADGEVIAARYSTSFGNMIILDHGGGITTVYAHCSRLEVSAGEHVRRGQTIAASGATGLAAGPHLHWEVRVNGRPVNPMGWF